jgi:hypothetical protein
VASVNAACFSSSAAPESTFSKRRLRWSSSEPTRRVPILAWSADSVTALKALQAVSRHAVDAVGFRFVAVQDVREDVAPALGRGFKLLALQVELRLRGRDGGIQGRKAAFDLRFGRR